MPNMPDDVFERISVQAKMPQFLEDVVRDWVRQYTKPMSDVEFLLLRKSWRDCQDVLLSHLADSPEAQSARDLLTVMMWATNPRWHALYPYDQHPSVGDIIAENEALKARVKELEAKMAQVSLPPSPYEVEAPKESTVYTVPVDVSPMSVKFSGLPDDRDVRSHDFVEQLRREYEEAKERFYADDSLRKRLADEEEEEARDKFNIRKEQERRLRGQAYMMGIHLGRSSTLTDNLTFAEYQRRARETAVYKDSIFEALNITPDESRLARLLKLTYTVMGLAGEVGEFANIVKKIERDGKTIEEMLNQLVDELGDVVWYVFACADEMGVPLEDIARHNLEKLAKRKAQRQLHDDGNR